MTRRCSCRSPTTASSSRRCRSSCPRFLIVGGLLAMRAIERRRDDSHDGMSTPDSKPGAGRRRARRRGGRRRLAHRPPDGRREPRAARARGVAGEPLTITRRRRRRPARARPRPGGRADPGPRPLLDRHPGALAQAGRGARGRVPDRHLRPPRPRALRRRPGRRLLARSARRGPRSSSSTPTAVDGEPILLAGHSMGAMTIAAWAEAHRGTVSERVRGVALLSTGLDQLNVRERRSSARSPARSRPCRASSPTRSSRRPARSGPVPSRSPAPPSATSALAPHARDEDIELTTRMALDCRPARPHRLRPSRCREEALLEKLDALDVPTIVVAGELDR